MSHTTTADEVIHLPACITEDDTANCFWDGYIRGNGEGESFFVFNGEVHYFNHPAEADIMGVWVNADGPSADTYVPAPWWGLDIVDHPDETTTTTTVPVSALAETGFTPGPVEMTGVVSGLVALTVGAALLIAAVRRARKMRA